jgi:hypothetical protein
MSKEEKLNLVNRRSFLKASIGVPLLCSLKQKEETHTSASLKIDLKSPTKAVNRKILGAGLMFPPFNPIKSVAAEIFGRGTSVRFWPGQLEDTEYEEKMSILSALDPSQILCFTDRIGHGNERVKYISSKNNNLEDYQKPEKIASDISWVMSRFKNLKYELKGNLHWEAWNEPQFKENGEWEANEFGKYVNDVAAAVKLLKLPVAVGAPLHMDKPEWNRQLCKTLNPKLVDFLVTHYYSFWADVKEPENNFLVRAGLGTVLREKVRRDLSLTTKFGNAKWKLHCSEWNLHPPSYKPPYYTTTDMAAALHAFSAIKVFLEENIESAQYFVLSSNEHFGAFGLNQDGSINTHLTGLTLKLINECLYGKLVKSNVTSPSYTLKIQQDGVYLSYQIPYLESMAYLWDNGTLKVLLANKHQSKPIHTNVKGVDLSKKTNLYKISEKSGRDNNKDESLEILTSNNDQTIVVPPASIILLTLTVK